MDPLFQVRILAGQAVAARAVGRERVDEHGHGVAMAPATVVRPAGGTMARSPERSAPTVAATASPAPAETGGLAVVVLAAGQGSRLRSRLPKPLHRLGGRALIDHVLRATAALTPAQVVVVTGHGAEAVGRHLDEAGATPPTLAHQAEQLGTAHAVLTALPALSEAIATVLVLYADTPLVRPETLRALVAARADAGARLALVTCPAPDPAGYGRILRDGDGRLVGIVEERDADATVRAITEINAGIYAFAADWLRASLPRIQASPGGEYYLPDLVGLAVAEAGDDGAWPVATVAAEIDEALGINDRAQLAEAARLLRQRVNRRLLLAGVTLVDPEATYIEDTVEIGPDTIIHPGCVIGGATTIGADCVIGPQALIDGCRIGDGCRVVASTLESAVMDEGADVGPYAHLRPGARLGAGVHVGNFAEVKNARLGAGSAVGHVSYIGDAEVGERVNIGAGTITANYEFHSRSKQRTIIGDDAYIGSDTVLVAPVEVGAGAATGAGAVVTRDVEPGTLVVGVPARPRPVD